MKFIDLRMLEVVVIVFENLWWWLLFVAWKLVCVAIRFHAHATNNIQLLPFVPVFKILKPKIFSLTCLISLYYFLILVAGTDCRF